MSTDFSAVVADSAAAWKQWVDTVEPEDRMVISELLSKYDTTTFEGMAIFLHQLIIQLFSGKVSPVVIQTGLPLIKELQTTLFMVHKYQQQPEMLGVSMRQTTTELLAAVKPVSANYTIAQNDVIEDPGESLTPKTPAKLTARGSGD